MLYSRHRDETFSLAASISPIPLDARNGSPTLYLRLPLPMVFTSLFTNVPIGKIYTRFYPVISLELLKPMGGCSSAEAASPVHSPDSLGAVPPSPEYRGDRSGTMVPKSLISALDSSNMTGLIVDCGSGHASLLIYEMVGNTPRQLDRRSLVKIEPFTP